jgi:hypothetical protein
MPFRITLFHITTHRFMAFIIMITTITPLSIVSFSIKTLTVIKFSMAILSMMTIAA